MNPQLLSQQPPGQFGQQPPLGQYGMPPGQGPRPPPTHMGGPPGPGAPPGPPGYSSGGQPPAPVSSMYNGPTGAPPLQRPPGPPGAYAPPGVKGVLPPPVSGAAPQPGMQNGPPSGPQGDQAQLRQPGQYPVTDSRPTPPPQGQQMPFRGGAPGPGPQPPGRPSPTQLTGQMGSMNLSGPPPRPGAATSMAGPPGQMSGPPSGPPGQMAGPPGQFGGPPPTQMGGPPPGQMGSSPRPMGGPPPGQMVGPPTGQMGGVPPGQMAGLPGQMAGHPRPMGGPPPGQMGGPPPGQMGGPPPGQMGGPPPGPTVRPPGPPGQFPGQPPTMPSQGQVIGGFPTSTPPPVSMGVQPPPPVSMYGSGTAPPMYAPGMGGAPPRPGGPPTSYPQPPASIAGPHSGPMMSAGTGPPQMGPGGIPNQGPPPLTPPGQFPAPGMGPPSPGAAGQQGGYGAARGMAPPPGPMSQPQQPRRLDPDQMPSPIQVIEDDRKNRSGLFQTGQKCLVPPLVTTDFITEDQGNCSPRLMRSTMYNIPCSSDMLKQSHIPFVLNIAPFARTMPTESQLPLVDLGQLGPVRCNRCKAYMCPMMLFVDGGRRFQCVFCGCSTDVPPEYFAHLDHTGRRVDLYERPELYLGAYEFVATEDYCKNNKLPKPPAFIFMIDVSYNAVKSGLVGLLCARLKEDVLVNLPKESGYDESEIRVGFVTYAKELHFYNVKGALAQPQMMVVSDVQDVFVPLLDGFLVKLSESESIIDSLLAQIPVMFAETRETELVLGPVIQAGLDALRAAECAGKLFIFHSSLPVAEAPGKLKNRDDRKLLGTDKEKTILTPQGSFYTKLGQECVTAGCTVDLFLTPNSYIDVATVAEVPRLTGGSVYKYAYFQADIDGERFIEDLKSHVSRPIAFDAIMRIRTSTGLRPVDFLGNFFMSNTTDVELASIDCDKSVTVEIKHDDKLTETEGAAVQSAILYTSMSGQRRLRVLNSGYSVCSQMADLFRNCELDTVVNYMAKLAIRESLNSNPKEVREHIMTRCAQILACYRKNCASPSSAGQLILPECMKLLPLYSACLVKSHVLQGTDITTDDRSYLCHSVNGMSVLDTHTFFYPRLLPIHDADPDTNVLPTAVRCSYERLQDSGVYLIENGLSMLLWIGINVKTDWIQSVFGVQSAAQIDIDKSTLQNLDNPISRRVRSIIRQMREERTRHLKLTIVRQRDKLEPLFQQYLVEDRGSAGSASYVDFLCHIHKEIRNLLS